MAVRFADCTRRQHLKREASETRFAQTADASLSVSGTGDASPSNGISLQRQLHKQPQPQPQPQRSLRGATSNCNGRCAEPQATTTVATRRSASHLWSIVNDVGLSTTGVICSRCLHPADAGSMTQTAAFQTVLRRSAFVPCFDLPVHDLVSTLALFLFPENPTWVVHIQTGSHPRM